MMTERELRKLRIAPENPVNNLISISPVYDVRVQFAMRRPRASTTWINSGFCLNMPYRTSWGLCIRRYENLHTSER